MKHTTVNYVKRIWIVSMLAGNPFVESDERAVCFASCLANNGYEVTYWGTTFNHVTKEYDFGWTTYKKVKDNEYAVMIHSNIVYKRNVSINRLLYTWEQALLLKKEIYKDKYPVPDLIFASYPSVESCDVLEEYGKKYDTTVVIDQRDRWPEVFERVIPEKIRFIAPYVLAPFRRRARKVYKGADAICAMSPVELRHAIRCAGRTKTNLDKYIYIGRRKHVPDNNTRKKIVEELRGIGVTSDTWNICLFTTLSKVNLDADSMIKAIELVHKKHPEIRLIVGGKGDDSQRLVDMTKDTPYIHFCGYLDADYMATIMSICKVGIIPYKNATMKDAWGNKIGQYLSYNLPILTSTEGIAKKYFNKYECGIAYEEGNEKDLADKLNKLIEDDIFLRQLSKNAGKRYNRDFQFDVVMNRFVNYIDKLLA